MKIPKSIGLLFDILQKRKKKMFPVTAINVVYSCKDIGTNGN